MALNPKSIAREQLIRRINHRIETGESNMLFIVGHMRSGSTLLVHLLANHPDILGYGETHHIYESTDDFGEVSYSILRKFQRFRPRELYYFDKVLHAEKKLTAQYLDYAGTRTLFLIRKPARALPSIIRLGLKKTATEELALRYYIERLESVAQLAEQLGATRSRLLTYEDLTENPTETLIGLTGFLDLSRPLKPEYKPLWSTGHPGTGDSSESIHSGKIIKTEQVAGIEIADDSMKAATAAYEGCIERCQHL